MNVSNQSDARIPLARSALVGARSPVRSGNRTGLFHAFKSCPSSAAVLFTFIELCAKANRWTLYTNRERIAKALGISVATVKRSLSALRRAGLISSRSRVKTDAEGNMRGRVLIVTLRRKVREAVGRWNSIAVRVTGDPLVKDDSIAVRVTGDPSVKCDSIAVRVTGDPTVCSNILGASSGRACSAPAATPTTDPNDEATRRVRSPSELIPRGTAANV